MVNNIVQTSPGVWQAKGADGMYPVQPGSANSRDISSLIGNPPVNDGSVADVPSPTTSTPNSGMGTASVPLIPTASNPYTIFNKNMAGLLTKIQQAQVSGGAELGGNIATATNVGVSPNGATPFDPNVSSSVQTAGREALSTAFQPVIANMNTRLTNTKDALNALSGSVETMMKAYAPQVVGPGMSLVTPDGKVVKQGHEYTPTLNTLSGLMDGFDTTTGTWSSDDMKTGGQTTPSVISTHPGSAIVAGINFGTTPSGIKPYATDPDYADTVNTMYNSIVSSQTATGGMPTSAGIDAYIKSHSGSSPVTGQMIWNAAAQYQIDPNILTAVLGHESGFGTNGVAAKTMNPGNVGNTDNGSTQTFKSWPQGVNAAAAELARRKVTVESTQGNKIDTSAIGGQFSDMAAQKVSQLPQYMQSYVDAGPKGVAYINDDRVPANAKDAVKTLASRQGIPYVQASDVSALKSIGVVYKSLDQMQKLADENLSPGTIGHAKDTLLGGAAQFLQTDWGNKLSLFNSYRDTAIKAVQALAGGAGSGLRINGAEIMANMNNLAGAGDSSEHANELIKQMKTLIDNQLTASFPYITSDSATSSDNTNSTVTMTGPKGTYQVTPDKVAQMQKNGYTIK